MRKLNSILLIDDDAINNYINTSLIKKLNLCKDVRTFKNGKEAIDYIETTVHPASSSLVFLDINMPIMDGYDFMNALKKMESNKKLKIAVLSTSIRLEDEERLKILGIDSFITKPLTEDKILDVIQQFEE